MKGWHHFDAVVLMPFPARLGNAFRCFQQRMRGDLPERADDFGANQRDLLAQKRLAGRKFFGGRFAVFRRTAFDRAGEIHLVAAQSNRAENFREHLARRADKRLAFTILMLPRRLADKHEDRVRIACAENDARSSFMEAAALASLKVLAQLIERQNDWFD